MKNNFANRATGLDQISFGFSKGGTPFVQIGTVKNSFGANYLAAKGWDFICDLCLRELERGGKPGDAFFVMAENAKAEGLL
jgi:hypothetical protein